MQPLKGLPDRFNLVKLSSLVRSCGIWPLSWLSFSDSTSRLESLASSDGTSPARELSDRSSTLRYVRFLTSSGILPSSPTLSRLTSVILLGEPLIVIPCQFSIASSVVQFSAAAPLSPSRPASSQLQSETSPWLAFGLATAVPPAHCPSPQNSSPSEIRSFLCTSCNSLGMQPVNSLLCSDRVLRFGIAPSWAGISPVNRFAARESISRLVRLPSSTGIAPLSILLSSDRCSSVAIAPN